MRIFILCFMAALVAFAWFACSDSGDDDDDAYGDYSSAINRMNAGCDLSMAGLENVGFTLNLASCEIWGDVDTDGDWVLPLTWQDFDIKVAGFQATSTQWAIGERFLVYGDFAIDGVGAVDIVIWPETELSTHTIFCSNATDFLWEPSGQFAILNQFEDIDDGELGTNDLRIDFDVYEFADETGRDNCISCLLEVD
ncbi:MAG TPA: hypothetical protein PKW95_10050 [bacterium]|nr:hypothetical protein [bacterium]